jgi:hypothetical protein
LLAGGSLLARRRLLVRGQPRLRRLRRGKPGGARRRGVVSSDELDRKVDREAYLSHSQLRCDGGRVNHEERETRTVSRKKITLG